MSTLRSDVSVVGQPLFSSSSTQLHALGERCVTADGREFRYCKAGATALVPGKLQQASAEVTANQDLTAVAAAIGDTSISASSTVTVTANQYAGGWVLVTVTPGQGYMYKIKSHIAYTAAAPTFQLEDSVQVALTTSSRLDLIANPFSAVIVNPATASSNPVGAAIYPVAASEFGWLQVKGPCNLLADGTVVVGTSLVASNATAGAVEALTGVQAAIGEAMSGIATTEYGAVMLNLP